jgi:heme-degrading monooxygenase HmoA
MITTSSTQDPQHVYRIDKFKVPPAARDEFLARARETHAFLHTLPGFVTSAIFQQSRGPGAFNFVTLVEWGER